MVEEYIFSVKKRKGYAQKNVIVYEVCVRMIGTEYDKFPISVGGSDRPYTFRDENKAIADCKLRIAEYTALGHQASFEIFDYDNYQSKRDPRLIHTEWLSKQTLVEIFHIEANEPEAYRFSLIFHNEQGEYYARAGNGEWYETLTACLADAYVEWIANHKMDSE